MTNKFKTAFPIEQWREIVNVLYDKDWNLTAALDSERLDNMISPARKNGLIFDLMTQGLITGVRGKYTARYDASMDMAKFKDNLENHKPFQVTKRGTAILRTIAGMSVPLKPEHHLIGKPQAN